MRSKNAAIRLRVAIPAVVLLLATISFSVAGPAWAGISTDSKAYRSLDAAMPATNRLLSLSNELVDLGSVSVDSMILAEAPTALPGTLANISEKNPEPTLLKGVNYLSQWHWYLPDVTTDDVLRRDFSRFRDDGVKYISIPLYWYRLEGDKRGDFTGSPSYGDSFLENVKRTIEIADQYGISTMVDIHTLWGPDGTWCTPAYVLDPVSNSRVELAVVRDDAMRQAFLDMFTHTVNYLKGTPGIWSWALNEPWYWPHRLNAPFDKIDQKENFITLFQGMKEITQAIDGRPFTVRFVSVHSEGSSMKDIFSDDWSWDPRIASCLDFVSFNAYLPGNADLESGWKEVIANQVRAYSEQGKQVWITEFGASSSDGVGTSAYQSTLDFLISLPVEGVLAWMWRGDKDERDPDPPNTGFNICANSKNGEGNQMYAEFTSARR